MFGGLGEGRSFPIFSESPCPPFIFLLHLVWIPSGKTAVRQLFSMVCAYSQEFTEVSLVKCIQADQILPLTPWIQKRSNKWIEGTYLLATFDIIPQFWKMFLSATIPLSNALVISSRGFQPWFCDSSVICWLIRWLRTPQNKICF